MENYRRYLRTYGTVPYRPALILEGVDGAGKTTLAQRLSEALHTLQAPRLAQSDGTLESDLYHKTESALVLAAEQGATIFDRSPAISEYVYGPTLDGRIEPPFRQKKAHLWGLLQRHAFVVLLRPSRGWARRNARQAPQEAGVLDHFDELYAAYEQVCRDVPALGVVYNPETATEDDEQDLILLLAAVTRLAPAEVSFA